MNSLVASRVQQFDACNGGDGVRCGNVVVYSNGAYRDVNPLGLLCEPSKNERERLTWVLRRHEELLQRAVAEFDDRKLHLNNLIQHGIKSGYGAPDEEALEQLKKLQAVVKKHQRAVRQTREKLEQTPEYRRRIVNQESVSRSRRDGESMLGKLREIDV